MGVIIDSFRSSGIFPHSRDLFKSILIGVTSESIHFFRSILGTPSGPGLELVFKVLIALAISIFDTGIRLVFVSSGRVISS